MSNDRDLIKLLNSLELNDFISFDLETTGLNLKEDKIIEISACRFKDGVFVDEFTSLVNPEISISKMISSLTGINNDMVNEKPLISDILPEFLKFIDKLPLVAHNINFDYNFINRFVKDDYLIKNNHTLYDTLSLSRSFLYHYNNFSLSALCAYYNIPIKSIHRARDDALNTGELFVNLIKEVSSKPLPLIQKLHNITNANNIINNKLFNNIIKTSIKQSSLDGIWSNSCTYQQPENIFKSISRDRKQDFPSSPESWFVENGLISSNWDGFETRTAQVKLVNDVYETLLNRDLLIAEAGTGLGKSLAYSASGFFVSNKLCVPLVISTHTKNLQSQLFNNDIPRLAKCINKDMKVIIYKGRNNYVCKRRLEDLLNNDLEHLSSNDFDGLMSIVVWEWETITGDISECFGFQLNRNKSLWSLINSETSLCSSQSCIKFGGCYLERVKQNIQDSDIIIVNHFLFSNEILRDNSSLPSDFIYVIDEAHHFADAIRDQIECKVGIKSFKDFLKLFNTIINRKMNLSLSGFPEIINKIEKLSIDFEKMLSQISSFFRSYSNVKENKLNHSDYNVTKILYKNVQQEFIDVEPTPWEILDHLKDYMYNVETVYKLLNKNQEKISKSFILEFNMIFNVLIDLVNKFESTIDSSSDLVKWATISNNSFYKDPIFNASPLNVRDLINTSLLQKFHGGIFCSATLRVNDEFGYFNKKTGLDLAILNQNIKHCTYSSPFYYADQVKLFLFNKRINIKDNAFIYDVGEQLLSLSKALNKRMLVLCTSFKQINSLKSYIDSKKTDEMNLFVQSNGVSRNLIIKNYLKYKNSILIGTSSFWEGVDLPGSDVEILYIVKTPFDNPYEPLVQAQIESHLNRGEDPFLEFQIPEAAMKFRQGFGRLIRNMNDSGICIISDTRLSSRDYGEFILNSLPVEPIYYNSVHSIIYESQKFFGA